MFSFVHALINQLSIIVITKFVYQILEISICFFPSYCIKVSGDVVIDSVNFILNYFVHTLFFFSLDFVGYGEFHVSGHGRICVH